MPVFQTIAARLHAPFFPKDVASFTVRTTVSIRSEPPTSASQ